MFLIINFQNSFNGLEDVLFFLPRGKQDRQMADISKVLLEDFAISAGVVFSFWHKVPLVHKDDNAFSFAVCQGQDVLILGRKAILGFEDNNTNIRGLDRTDGA